jgi:hypothetical protein
MLTVPADRRGTIHRALARRLFLRLLLLAVNRKLSALALRAGAPPSFLERGSFSFLLSADSSDSVTSVLNPTFHNHAIHNVDYRLSQKVFSTC